MNLSPHPKIQVFVILLTICCCITTAAPMESSLSPQTSILNPETRTCASSQQPSGKTEYHFKSIKLQVSDAISSLMTDYKSIAMDGLPIYVDTVSAAFRNEVIPDDGEDFFDPSMKLFHEAAEDDFFDMMKLFHESAVLRKGEIISDLEVDYTTTVDRIFRWNLLLNFDFLNKETIPVDDVVKTLLNYFKTELVYYLSDLFLKRMDLVLSEDRNRLGEDRHISPVHQMWLVDNLELNGRELGFNIMKTTLKRKYDVHVREAKAQLSKYFSEKMAGTSTVLKEKLIKQLSC